MKRWNSILAICTLALLGAPAAVAADAASPFLARVYTNASGKKLPYRLLLPQDYDPQKKYPIILYLHGAAARGSDNAEPLKWGPELFLDPALRGKHGFLLVVPQAPRDSGWTEWSWMGAPEETPALAMSLQLVTEALPRDYSIDAKRRYLTGVSMGGHAVWVTLVRHPGMFAAAVPVCAGGTPSLVTRETARTPVWAFHSDDDHLVPVQQARELVKAWRAHGGEAKYTEYTGLRHSSWKKAYADPAMFDWLLAQRRP